jgi:hypothetical protein
MNLENCFICKRPVLELTGQFGNLDTYFLNEDDLAYQEGAFGCCHTHCLSTSSWGRFWSQRRILHFTQVMGFQKLYSNDSFTIICNPCTNDKLVLRDDGVSFTVKDSLFKNKKECSEGILIPILEEMNLEFDNPELTHNIRNQLIKTKSFPLNHLIQALDLNDYMLYPNAIMDGALIFNESLQREWIGNWVSADVSYHQFIPQDIVDVMQ